jgi:predicted amidohydrolase
LRAGLIQLCCGDDPSANLAQTEALIRDAAGEGAGLVLTPECTNLVSASRARQASLLTREAEDATLARLRVVAADLRIWLLVGSLLLKSDDPEDDRFINRSLLVGPDGGIVARYDKIHMFDVDLGAGERYRESAAFRPGGQAVVAPAAGISLGMTICYDLRFPGLYRRLAQGGAQVLAIPSAFTVPTGKAHWEPLLRARAIETGSYVLAPAQSGEHLASEGAPRRTWGHSLAVSPWGEVLADGGDPVGVTLVDLDPEAVAEARARVPSLQHDRDFAEP